MDKIQTYIDDAWVDYDSACLEAAQRIPSVLNDGVPVPRVPYGNERVPLAAPVCPDCGASTGQLHGVVCEIEECPLCGEHTLECDCPGVGLCAYRPPDPQGVFRGGVPLTWLRRPLAPDELSTVTTDLQAHTQGSDELWEFASPGGPVGCQSGHAVVRDSTIVAYQVLLTATAWVCQKARTLVPNTGSPWLPVATVIQRAAAEFACVVTEETRAKQHLADRLLEEKPGFDRQTAVEYLQVEMICVDDLWPDEPFLRCLVVPEQPIKVLYDFDGHEEAAAGLLERLRRVLDYAIID